MRKSFLPVTRLVSGLVFGFFVVSCGAENSQTPGSGDSGAGGTSNAGTPGGGSGGGGAGNAGTSGRDSGAAGSCVSGEAGTAASGSVALLDALPPPGCGPA